MMTTGRAVVDPEVVRRHNDLADLYNDWPGDPDDDPDFVEQAREIMDLPPLEDDFPALRSELADFDDDEVARALTAAFTDLDRARYGTGVGERIPEGHVGGGRFRKLTDRLTDLLEDWVKGEGPDDPLDEFSREQLRQTAKKLADKANADGDGDRAARLTPRRGASSDEIKLALYTDIRATRRGDRDVPDGKPEPKKVTPAKKAAPRRVAKPAKTGDEALAAAPIDFSKNHPDTGLTPDEEFVFQDYIVDGAYAINPTLREYKGHTDPHDDDTAGQVRLMDAAMSRSPLSTDVRVERGISHGADEDMFGGRWQEDLTGATLLDYGFMSTTTRVGGGAHYAEQEGQPSGQATLLIRVPAGIQAVKMSGADHESELLLQRGLTIRVISDSGYSPDGGRRIEAEVIGKPVAPPMKTGAEFDAMTDAQQRQHMKDSGFSDSVIENSLGPAPVKTTAPAAKAAPKPPDVDLSTLDDPEALRDALDLKKVPELKDMLRERKLPVSGRKRELVDRLVEHHSGKGEGASTKGDGLEDLATGPLADLAREHDIDVPYPPRESDRDSILGKLRAKGIVAPTDEPRATEGSSFITDRHIADLNALAAGPARVLSSQTGANRQRNGRLDDLRRMGFARREGDRYVITAAGREHLASLLAADTPSADGLDEMSDNSLKSLAAEFDMPRASEKSRAQHLAFLREQGVVSPKVRQQRLDAEDAAVAKAKAERLARVEPLSTDPPTRATQIQNRIRTAYAELVAERGTDNPWVMLADLRDRLAEAGGLSRQELDEHLTIANRMQGTRVIPESNQKTLTDRDWDAAVVIGNQYKHLISIKDPDTKTVAEYQEMGVSGFPEAPEVPKTPPAQRPATTPAPTRRPVGVVYELPPGVTDADYRALVDAYRRRRDKTGIPGADNPVLAERASVEANSEHILRHFQEWNERQIGHLTISEAQAELGRRVRKAFADRQVATNLDTGDLKDVLRDQRFKTQFETGDSGGVYQPDERRFREGMWFGLPDDTPPERRPIYGYLVTGSGTGKVDIYGDAQVILRPEVRRRTTAMVGDSMENILGGRPSPVDDPEWFSFTPNADTDVLDQLERNYDGPKFNRTAYIEAQVHGGVTLDDIAEIVLSSPPDAELRRLLQQSGIKWRTRRRS